MVQNLVRTCSTCVVISRDLWSGDDEFDGGVVGGGEISGWKKWLDVKVWNKIQFLGQ